ncbi:MAG TPA: hypothetical protein VJO52_15820 [Gemmatimonadaceae bacterium]|nr:hypothetical protein [Gemmatimonadaceae bacterium]
MPYSRIVQINVRSRAAAAALGVTALVAGGVLLAFGLTLLAGAAVVGLAAGGGLMLYRRLAGRAGHRTPVRHGLDPSLEVFPARSSERPGLEPRSH